MLCEVKHKEELKGRKYVQFLLSPENYTIIMGTQGHEQLLYDFNLSRRDYCYGGYIRTESRDIVPITGTVENIPKNLWEVVVADLSEFFGFDIRMDPYYT